MSALLEIEGLTKRFGGVTAVDACSFTVPEGSVTALVGPNGSGKTTAFNLITGYATVFVVVLLVLPRGILPSLRDGLTRTRERRRTRRVEAPA